MTKWHDAMAGSDLPDGEMKEITLGDTFILLVNQGDKIYAVGATCPHQGISLEDGYIDKDHVVCASHMWRFQISTGTAVLPPGKDLPVWRTKVEGGRIFIGNRVDPHAFKD
jgi:nitrite reductase/ring-hydroxylating ferredoxin subunit